MILRATEVTYRYPGAEEPALLGVSLQVARGEVVTVSGPNGSGKTTLLRVALGRLRAASGHVELAGREVSTWSGRDLARRVAVVTQREEIAFPMRVKDVVALGRYPHLSPWGGLTPADHAAVAEALERVDAAHLGGRWIDTLSGGEWQRVRLARAMAQDPGLLVLDEPTTSLDLRHEMELFGLLASLAEDEGLGVVVVTHEVNLAARFADRMLLLAGGRVAAHGSPDVVMRAETIEGVFQWPVEVVALEGVRQFLPRREALR